MTYYTVYRTQNLVNGKYYFGVHKTENPYDGYLGSGKVLKHAVRKYREQSFLKNVCFIFDNPADAFEKEFELIETYRDDPACYNLRQGGSGGFDFINREGLSGCVEGGKVANKKLQQFLRDNPQIGKDAARRNWKKKWDESGEFREHTRQVAREMSLKAAAKWKNGGHSQELRDRMSESHKGCRSSMFEMRWMHHIALRQSSPVKLELVKDYLNNGWLDGRVQNWDLLRDCENCGTPFKAWKDEQLCCTRRCAGERTRKVMPSVDTLLPLLGKYSYRKLAAQFNVSHSTVKQWACILGLSGVRKKTN